MYVLRRKCENVTYFPPFDLADRTPHERKVALNENEKRQAQTNFGSGSVQFLFDLGVCG
jgi:hypothetical protein